MEICMVPIAIGLDPVLEGLFRVDHPEIMSVEGAWIFGAWQFGYGTIHHGGGIEPGRDWFAVVYRSREGRVSSYGRIRNHQEFLGIEDEKVFYTAKSSDERELVKIYERVSRRLSEEWGHTPRKILGVDGAGYFKWLTTLPEVSISTCPPSRCR